MTDLAVNNQVGTLHGCVANIKTEPGMTISHFSPEWNSSCDYVVSRVKTTLTRDKPSLYKQIKLL